MESTFSHKPKGAHSEQLINEFRP